MDSVTAVLPFDCGLRPVACVCCLRVLPAEPRPPIADHLFLTGNTSHFRETGRS